MTPTATEKAAGPTEDLSSWIASVKLSDIPEEIRTRAKYLILDGLACGLIGAHLPSSEKAAKALFNIEPAGDATVFGWDRKISPLAGALLNSTFIQGFELDDWHSEAPLHSNSILLPALFAAAQHLEARTSSCSISGSDLLLATIVGYEVGPRVGLALHGSHVLTTGWHSGAVFGPAAAAAAAGKLLKLSAGQIEDAFGIACTQACGLMSAQFGSEVKRMQHGFAARNGLLGALLAKNEYTGIKKVFEHEYGGFLKQFSSGNGKDPQYLPEELMAGIGTKWQTKGVRVKPYASMAGTHSTVDCVRELQDRHPQQMKMFGDMKKIKIEMGEAAYHHGGWKAERPLTSTGAQMSNSYVAATQIIYGEVLAAQFRHDKLENDELWRLVDVTDCHFTSDMPKCAGIVTIDFHDGSTLKQRVEAARGVIPALSNSEIEQKWRSLTKGIIDEERARKIEEMVISLEKCPEVATIIDLMGGITKNPIA